MVNLDSHCTFTVLTESASQWALENLKHVKKTRCRRILIARLDFHSGIKRRKQTCRSGNGRLFCAEKSACCPPKSVIGWCHTFRYCLSIGFGQPVNVDSVWNHHAGHSGVMDGVHYGAYGSALTQTTVVSGNLRSPREKRIINHFSAWKSDFQVWLPVSLTPTNRSAKSLRDWFRRSNLGRVNDLNRPSVGVIEI